MSVGLTPAAGRAVWHGPQIDYRADGMHVLSAAEIAEIDAALAHLHSLGTLDFPEITPETFPLPKLGRFFDKLGRELRYGRGFLLLRGLPRERYALDDIGHVYYGLGVHLGRPVAQSHQGELLGNVIDVSDVEAPFFPAAGSFGAATMPIADTVFRPVPPAPFRTPRAGAAAGAFTRFPC